MTTANEYPIRAVDRVCDILDLLQEHADGVILTKIAAHTKMPKSSTFRYLAALEARQYVDRDESTGLYQLGLAFRPAQSRTVERFLELIRPDLEDLRRRSGETVNVGLLDGSMVAHVEVLESPNIMRLAARIGERAPIHVTALGKAIAAELPTSRVLSILESEGMPRVNDRTITSVDEYLAELERVREQGYALDDQEAQEDGRCVAVPIRDVELPVALSISAPAHRLLPDGVPAEVTRLKKTARAIGRRYRGLG